MFALYSAEVKKIVGIAIPICATLVTEIIRHKKYKKKY